ncbi:MAG: hypothetical protein V4642_05320 [Bacteroidota bacterium]
MKENRHCEEVFRRGNLISTSYGFKNADCFVGRPSRNDGRGWFWLFKEVLKSFKNSAPDGKQGCYVLNFLKKILNFDPGGVAGL